MRHDADVLILGGGVIGLTTAWFLCRDGVRVRLVDAGEPGRQASWAGAGILPPADPSRAQTGLERLHALSAALFPEISSLLKEETGVDNGYRLCGGLEVPEDASAQRPSDEWAGPGVPFRWVEGPVLAGLEPGLAPSLPGAFHLPGLAQVRNPRHVSALLAGCRARGVEVQVEAPVRRLVCAGARVEAALTDAGPLRAARYLVAAGAWSEELLAPLGWTPGIEPVRGQISQFNTRKPGQRPVLLQGKRYLVPREDGLILAGSTEEYAGFDASTTAEGIAGLVRFARGLLPELAEVEPERTWAGLRPGSRDDLPYLGTVPGLDNLFVAAGHFRAGLQLSPGTGRVMANLLQGKAPTLPLEDFRLDRALRPPAQGVFRS